MVKRKRVFKLFIIKRKHFINPKCKYWKVHQELYMIEKS
jgi:hypothetical protein